MLILLIFSSQVYDFDISFYYEVAQSVSRGKILLFWFVDTFAIRQVGVDFVVIDFPITCIYL